MTLDPSIILSGRPVQVQSPFEQAGQAMQLRELSMNMKAKAQAQADDEAIRKAFAANQNPDGSLNRQGVLAALATGNPMARQKLEHTWATEDAARTKAQNDAREAAMKVDAALGKLMADVGGAVLQAHQEGKPEEAQRAWQTGLQRAKAAGLNVDGLPAQYDPQMAAGYYQIGISALERFKEDGYEGFHQTEDGTAVQVNKRTGQARPIRDFQGNPIKGRMQPPVQVNVGEQKEFTNETTLRKEYNDEIKGFKSVKDSFRRIEIAGKNNTAASDISLIYGYMKLMDPGSVVREGEFATAQNAGGIPDRIRAAYNQAISGERLAPDVKADFLKQAQLIYEQALAQQQAVAGRYRGIAERFRLNPDNVVTDETVRPGANRPRLGEIVDGFRYEGGDPGRPESWKKVKQ